MGSARAPRALRGASPRRKETRVSENTAYLSMRRPFAVGEGADRCTRGRVRSPMIKWRIWTLLRHGRYIRFPRPMTKEWGIAMLAKTPPDMKIPRLTMLLPLLGERAGVRAVVIFNTI